MSLKKQYQYMLLFTAGFTALSIMSWNVFGSLHPLIKVVLIAQPVTCGAFTYATKKDLDEQRKKNKKLSNTNLEENDIMDNDITLEKTKGKYLSNNKSLSVKNDIDKTDNISILFDEKDNNGLSHKKR